MSILSLLMLFALGSRASCLPELSLSELCYVVRCPKSRCPTRDAVTSFSLQLSVVVLTHEVSVLGLTIVVNPGDAGNRGALANTFSLSQQGSKRHAQTPPPF